MKRLILKLCVLCALTAVYASGVDRIPPDGGGGGGGSDGGGGGGGGGSVCTGADGVTCTCPAGQTCVTGRIPCTCI